MKLSRFILLRKFEILNAYVHSIKTAKTAKTEWIYVSGLKGPGVEP